MQVVMRDLINEARSQYILRNGRPREAATDLLISGDDILQYIREMKEDGLGYANELTTLVAERGVKALTGKVLLGCRIRIVEDKAIPLGGIATCILPHPW